MRDNRSLIEKSPPPAGTRCQAAEPMRGSRCRKAATVTVGSWFMDTRKPVLTWLCAKCAGISSAPKPQNPMTDKQGRASG